ncbi:MAG TPA: T9SS type A sorting domain-containing protein [Patescibacteria group bacterium]|nr:T9SS type A sorting domain-containing protein [Patescibacteria group bacterium]
MNAFKNKKTQLDEYFAEARTSSNIPAAQHLLKTSAPRNLFKNTATKISFAGVATVALTSFFLLKDAAIRRQDNLLQGATEVAQQENFIQETEQQNVAVEAPAQNPEKSVLKTASGVKPAIKSYPHAPKSEPLWREIATPQKSDNKQQSAIPLLELDAVELKRLGIEVLKDGDFAFTFAHTNVHSTVVATTKNIYPRPVIREVPWHEHLKNPPPSFVPIRITDNTGNKEFFSAANDIVQKLEEAEMPDKLKEFYQYASRNAITPEIKELIETWHIRSKTICDSVNRLSEYLPIRAGNFIVWYSPSEEVLERLPNYIVTSIRTELLGKSAIIQMEEFHERYPTSGFCYLDLCEKTNGAIACSKVYPNPAADKRTAVSYELAEARNITLALFDLSGRKLRDLSSVQPRSEGKHEEEISLVGIDKGIYLIAILTDKGEKLSRRLIVD